MVNHAVNSIQCVVLTRYKSVRKPILRIMTSTSQRPDGEDEGVMSKESQISCPVCNRNFANEVIEDHVNKCLFLNTQSKVSGPSKRTGLQMNNCPQEKRLKLGISASASESRLRRESSPLLGQANRNKTAIATSSKKSITNTHNKSLNNTSSSMKPVEKSAKGPLAEQMRPLTLDDLVGQTAAFGQSSMLRSMLEQNKVPNMILWGPPGCGKTSLANVVSHICKQNNNTLRFVKLSATMAGINDVKEVVKVAQNEAKFKRHTILFMDEIHRFNKLQQDTFLPHVENGTITLIGATTENPSFSLNNALLSRCRVVILEKLSVEHIITILERAISKNKDVHIVDQESQFDCDLDGDHVPRYLVERASLRWLAEVSDGDARVALGALELALNARDPGPDLLTSGPSTLTLEDIKEGIKRSHMVYDHHGEEHYNTVSAIHKSIRASDDNAALYWTTRALHCGEDPIFIARRLVRAACEDIGLGDQNAIVEAVACMQGCQQVGMPECDVLLAQCAVRLARATKSTEVYRAMKRCQRSLKELKGPLPPIPLHLRNAPTKLMKQIGYGRGYNTQHKDQSGLTYMPDGMEHIDYFGSSHDESAA